MDPAERAPSPDQGPQVPDGSTETPDPAAPLDATLLSTGLDPERLARLERTLTQSMEALLPAIEELAS